MDFSVVIPTYKTSTDMLLRAIESVMNQTYKPSEIIVVDDNPRDSIWKRNILDFSKNYDKSVKFLFHDDNLGANAARNTGITASSGEVIAFLDSDDEWSKDYLQEVKDAYMGSNVVITASEIIRVFPNRTSQTIKKHPDGNIYNELVLGDIVGPTSAVTVKRQILIDAGLFDEELPARQDYDMWLRVCKLGLIKYIRKPLVKLYCDEHNRISSGITNHERGTLAVMEKLCNDPELLDRKEEIIFAHTRYLGDKCLREENYGKARKYYKEALKEHKSLNIWIRYYASYFPFALKIFRCLARAAINKNGVKE